MQRGIWGYLALLIALLLVLSGCASSRDRSMARIFEAPNVIHVCVRPPNVPNDKRIWALDTNGTPVFEAREVDLARGAGLAVYVFDAGAPRESARILPIPYHRLECPAPPKPRVAAAKVEARKKEESKEAEAKKAEQPKPLPQSIPRDASAVERHVEALRCTAYEEPGQTRRRSSTGARTCTRVLVHRGHTEPAIAESPREVEPPVPVRLSEDAAREYEDWGLSPADTSALAEDRARECLQGLCHARHPNFVPKSKKKPAETHNGQSLSSGGKAPSAGGGAKTTTVKTKTRILGKPNGAKPNGAAAGQASAAGSGSGGTAATPKPVGENSGAGPYSHLKDHPSVGPGKDYTKRQKQMFLAENEARNTGTLKDDRTGEPLVRPQKHQKGVSPPENEAHVDHRHPRSKDGPNSAANADVRSRVNNLQKGSKTEP
ncbi:hypothetical protein [Polyangium sorediatum]|uniref:Lipoprotein n=1 Tax=Polyangium sorediatum TaxID=889274 RepID=A0ABT6NP09_9BACT|nr:hypothetical protein [Polyangium sorediatum]MDI1429920.1 hypothetical protein [Polyangium sorediatum]